MTHRIAGLPALAWSVAEGEVRIDSAANLADLIASSGVDWSNDSLGGPQRHDAALLGFELPDGDFGLSAQVTVKRPRTTFDAAALALWTDRDHWAKLCFEYSPRGEAMVVSVVTNGYSDDCNSTVVDDDSVHLRIKRIGTAFAFHSSLDGHDWTFVRLFRLPTTSRSRIGLLAQAPTGTPCTARFAELSLVRAPARDLRDGS